MEVTPDTEALTLDLYAPKFTFSLAKPDSTEDEVKTFEGVAGSNLPDRVKVISNRDYNLNIATHSEKWFVFAVLTLFTSGIPYFLYTRSSKALLRKLQTHSKKSN